LRASRKKWLWGTHRNCFVLALVLSTVLLAMSACGLEEPGSARLGGTVALPLGAEADFGGGAFKARFLDVIEDTRCPVGATCSTPGRAVALAEFMVGGQTETVRLEVGEGLPYEMGYRGFRVAFTVKPLTQKDMTIKHEEYRLGLAVTRAGDAGR
jgi:hypothetical protein